MPSSSTSVQGCINHALRFGDIKPVLQTGGSSMEPALSIANQVMMELLKKDFNWKFNSFLVPPFQTISWQNDYASSLTNIGWLENGVAIDINSSQIPKRKYNLEVVRDLQPTSDSYGRPFQVCWLPNTILGYGSWGTGLTTPNTNNTGQTNPGPSVVYTQPLGATTTPANPITQIIDPNGNYQLLTTYGVCGAFNPSWPPANATVGTPTIDGTCVWTVVDPYGQGFRIQQIPAQAGVVWQIMLRAQAKPPKFTSLGQFINPVPDDFAEYFKQGFVTYCYQRSPEAAIRAKFQNEYLLWQKALTDSQEQADRETESWGAYPTDSLLGSGDEFCGPRADWPFGSY